MHEGAHAGLEGEVLGVDTGLHTVTVQKADGSSLTFRTNETVLLATA